MSLTLDHDRALEAVEDYCRDEGRCQRCECLREDCACYCCPKCKGQGGGHVRETAYETCTRCDGTGMVGWLTNAERARLVADGYVPPELEVDDDPTSASALRAFIHKHNAACACHLCRMEPTERAHDDTAAMVRR